MKIHAGVCTLNLSLHRFLVRLCIHHSRCLESLHTSIYTTQRGGESDQWLLSLSIPPPVPCWTCDDPPRCLKSYHEPKGCIQGDIWPKEGKGKKTPKAGGEDWEYWAWWLSSQSIHPFLVGLVLTFQDGVIPWNRRFHTRRYRTQRGKGKRKPRKLAAKIESDMVWRRISWWLSSLSMPPASIQKLERTPVYIVALWWQPPAINISSSKEKLSTYTISI